ncbi:MAG: hypothetical protein HKN68_23065 [Saprospiraceae bacterium]|nr:hypothetical protein [Saprospiraceae bacterium]
MKTILFIIASLFLYQSGNSKDVINLYQPENTLQSIENDLVFWSEKNLSNEQSTYQLRLAQTWMRHFKVTSDINALNKAVEITEIVYHQSPLNRGPVCRSLARMYISQHRFCNALDMALESSEIGDNERASSLLLYDVYAELGMDQAAQEMMALVSNHKDFNYLIRAAKWEDAQGNLSQAINFLEKARDLAESGKEDSQLNWIYSNLGDFYGHAGNIPESKKSFMKALEVNPADWYSMKGLAWIYYSGEGDTDHAHSILNRIKEYNQSPDIRLLESQIHIYEGKTYYGNNLKEVVIKNLDNDDYGIMYRTVIAEHLASNGVHKKAIELAKAEVYSRNIPETNALLAFCKYKAGFKEEAFSIAKTQVLHKTYEPVALYHIMESVRPLKSTYREICKEVLSADYELGPVKIKKIKSIAQRNDSDLVNAY